MNKTTKKIIVGLIIGFTLLGALFFLFICGGKLMESKIKTVNSYDRLKKSSQIVDYLRNNYPFANKSLFDPEKPPVFSNFGPYPTILIYTVVNSEEQDKMLKMVKEYMSKNDIKVVVVKFYEKENWVEKRDSSGNISGGYKGEEKLLREVTLK